MRYFFRRRIPAVSRILLVESGSRHLIENLLPTLHRLYGEHVLIDLVTCYAGSPAGLPASATVFRVSDYAGPSGRKRLYSELATRGYSVMGILCSAEPIMFKWKWALAARVPAKLFIVNENGDFFWFEYAQWRTIVRFLSYRSGLSGADAVRTMLRIAIFPFTLSYLLLFAAAVHLRRKVHG